MDGLANFRLSSERAHAVRWDSSGKDTKRVQVLLLICNRSVRF